MWGLMCAQKLTDASLIYRTGPKTKTSKMKKLKNKRICSFTFTTSEEGVPFTSSKVQMSLFTCLYSGHGFWIEYEFVGFSELFKRVHKCAVVKSFFVIAVLLFSVDNGMLMQYWSERNGVGTGLCIGNAEVFLFMWNSSIHISMTVWIRIIQYILSVRRPTSRQWFIRSSELLTTLSYNAYSVSYTHLTLPTNREV